ncbi:MAG: trypsin-like peptidase domain-containing protein [Planctomycetaceae bacterium]|nr:trypsin-like peptidase domain-containing protein [Planctomycetales bacterium]MCB9922627.1 trypsin-like peptidase domain-containing protein [Planctomycetaceae bacterium]
MDLAIIELDDPTPFDNVRPVEFAQGLPKLQSPVQVIGYPTGGSTISVTEGVVSRIEHRSYSYGAEGLRIQVDAAINPGNSGGPAVADGKVIGIAFQKQNSADNIGYLIPSEEVAAFLADIKDGNYDGKPSIRVTYQNLLNRGFRDSLGLDAAMKEVVIQDILSEESEYPLQVGDVVTHVGTYDLDNSGIARFSDELRFELSYFESIVAKDGKVPLTIIRDDTEVKVDVPLEEKPLELFRSLKGESPEYFVYGPLVFVEATADFTAALEAQMLGSDLSVRAHSVAMLRLLMWRDSPLVSRRYDEPAFEGEQLVMLSNSLPHKISLGYGSPATNVVKAVNGTDIRNMRHLVELLRDSKDEFIHSDFDAKFSEKLVFSREEIEAASDDILTANGVSRRASTELLEVWEAE